MTALARIWLAAAGTAAGTLIGGGALSGVLVALCGAAVLAVRRRPLVAGAALVCLAGGLGATSVALREARMKPLESLARGVPPCRVEGAISEQIGGLGTLIGLETVDCGSRGGLRHAGTVVAELPEAPAGASLAGVGWLLPLGEDEFDVARHRLGAAAELELQSAEVGPVRSLVARLADAVRGGLHRATEGLGSDRSALLRGLAVGDTGGMSKGTEEALRRAGLSHLVAVSGSNVAIVLGAVAVAARRLSAHTRLAAGAGALGWFVLVVGPEPSVLRAAAMGAIALAAIALGRRAEPLHALGLAAIVVLGARPGLVYSIGLHLSIAATAGIVLWAVPLAERWPRIPYFIAVPLAVTVSAQAAVAPFLILAFGELSVVAPIANTLAVPAVPFATIGALGAGLVAIVHGGAGALLASIASPAAGWILEVGRHLGTATWASVDVPPITGWMAAAVLAGAVWRTLRSGLGRAPTGGL